MTEIYASTVALVIPVLALAAVIEGRSTQRNAHDTLMRFTTPFLRILRGLKKKYSTPQDRAKALKRFLEGNRSSTKDYSNISFQLFMFRWIALFIFLPFAWMLLLAALALGEIASLYWLAGGHGQDDSDLSTFLLVIVSVATGILVIAPALQIFMGPLIATPLSIALSFYAEAESIVGEFPISNGPGRAVLSWLTRFLSTQVELREALRYMDEIDEDSIDDFILPGDSQLPDDAQEELEVKPPMAPGPDESLS
ncbi:hypothetical protein SAMN05216489_03988 [Streptomyces sp. 3213]|nr:hypothetical protein SAMN05216489_03988 [Streptomyces sp. 3213] [Streptomyces sp. 3213.3]